MSAVVFIVKTGLLSENAFRICSPVNFLPFTVTLNTVPEEDVSLISMIFSRLLGVLSINFSFFAISIKSSLEKTTEDVYWGDNLSPLLGTDFKYGTDEPHIFSASSVLPPDMA